MYVRLSDSQLPPINESEVVLGPNFLGIVKEFAGLIGSHVTMAVPMMSRNPAYGVELALRIQEVLGCVQGVACTWAGWVAVIGVFVVNYSCHEGSLL